MPRDSQGTFENVHNWPQDAANGIGIEPDRHQEGDDDQAQGLTDSLDRKGRGGMQAGLAMGNFAITQVAEGTNATDGVNIAQVQKGAFAYATDTGSANTYQIILAPAPTAYTDGMRAVFVAANANTGASTLQVGGLTPAPAIQWQGAALSGGEISASGIVEVEFSAEAWQLLNVPALLPIAYGGTGGTTGARTLGQFSTSLDATGWRPNVTGGSGAEVSNQQAGGVMYTSLPYGNTAIEAAQTAWQVPTSVDRSAPIDGRFLWTGVPIGGSYDVVWRVRAAVVGNGGNINATFGAYVDVTADGSQNSYRVAAFAGMVPGGSWTANSTLMLEVSRDPLDAADTLAGDAQFVGLEIEPTYNLPNDD